MLRACHKTCATTESKRAVRMREILDCMSHNLLFFFFFRNSAGRHATVTVKRPPPHTSNSNHLRNHANRARKSCRSDVPIILPGWERRSTPTVHPCGLRSGGCGQLKPQALDVPNVNPYGRPSPSWQRSSSFRPTAQHTQHLDEVDPDQEHSQDR